MKHQQSVIHHSIEVFHRTATWNFWGSLFYESLRIANNIILAVLLSPRDFGILGSLFAITYFVVRVSDAGASGSLIPFFRYVEDSSASFKRFFVHRLFLPLIFTALVGASITWFFYTLLRPGLLAYGLHYTLLMALLITSETIRSFLRQFLHAAGLSKEALLADHTTFLFYLVISWTVLAYVPVLRSPLFIFFFFLIDALIGLSWFLFLTARYAKALPLPQRAAPTVPESRDFLRVRLLSWAMRILKEVFSSNALTPLFAATVGLREAGLFYLAATTATALHSIMRSVVGYAGVHFLMRARKTAISVNEAFSIVSRKVNIIILGLIFFITFAHRDILSLTQTAAAYSLVTAFFIIYFVIVMIEFTLLLYEQHYCIEKVGEKILQWRAFEFLLGYAAVYYLARITPVPSLICILTAKTITLVAVGLHGYRRWLIKPSLELRARQIFLLALASASAAGIFHLFLLFFRHAN